MDSSDIDDFNDILLLRQIRQRRLAERAGNRDSSDEESSSDDDNSSEDDSSSDGESSSEEDAEQYFRNEWQIRDDKR